MDIVLGVLGKLTTEGLEKETPVLQCETIQDFTLGVTLSRDAHFAHHYN